MKTVQDWLRAVDLKELTDRFFWTYPIDFKMLPDSEHTIRDIRGHARERFMDYVERMRAVPLPQTESADWVFFASKEYKSGLSQVGVQMCKLPNLQKEAEPECFSWLLVDHAEVMGYWVADTELTEKNILDVLAEILYEATFFGYTQADMDREREKLNQSIQEAEAGRTYTMEEIQEQFGLPPLEKDPVEEEMLYKIYAAENEYDTFFKKREMEKLRAKLKRDEN